MWWDNVVTNLKAILRNGPEYERSGPLKRSCRFERRRGQQAFEKTHSRKEFRDIFGKNYLEDRMMQQERRKRETGEENQKTVLEGFSWLKEEEVGR